MNFSRILANAVARRLAFIIVATVFGFIASCFAASDAHAITLAEAMAGCQGQADNYNSNPNRSYQQHCENQAELLRVARIGVLIAPPHTVEPVQYIYYTNNCPTSGTQDVNINTTIWGNPGTYCADGCELSLSDPECTTVTEGPNPGMWCNYVGTQTGTPCYVEDQPPNDPDDPEQCPEGQVQLPDGSCGEQGECPVGQHEVNGECHPTGECQAGQVKGPDGSCNDEQCPVGQAMGSDGSCKPDEDGDGEPDEGEDDGSFSGGEDCRTPPQCSGDNILCGQARIQWRIDCNTRKNRTVTGGNGCGPGSVPICTGEKCDAMEYSLLLQAHATKCAVEALELGDGGPGEPGDTASYDGEGDSANIVNTVAGEGDPGDGFTDGSEGGGGDGELDTSGFGYGSSCPMLPSVSVFGNTIDFQAAAGGVMCDWFTLGGHIVLILAALMSLRILASAGSV